MTTTPLEPAETASHPTAVVTGASRGLGATVARFLAGRGFDLVLTARGGADLAREADRLRELGTTVTDIPGDVADSGHRQNLSEAVAAAGRLDVLVHNASELGPSPLRPLVEVDAPSFARVFEVNVAAPVALTRALLGPLEVAHGLVIHITSDAALGGYPGWGVYGASKAALDLVSRTLSVELSARGIAVTAVDPGDMRTAMHQAAYPGESIEDRPLPEATIPFFTWLFGQEHASVTGGRFRAQSETWEAVPA